MCVVQSLLHAGLHMDASRAWQTIPAIAISCLCKVHIAPANMLQLLAILCLIVLSSVLYLRRAIYECFLKIHLLLAIAIGALLWFHIPLHLDLPTVCLTAACGMWITQTLAWVARFMYRNVGGKQVREASVPYLGEEGFAPSALTLEIQLKRAWQVRSGQYVYITVLSNPRHLFGQIQAQPFLIAWSEESPGPTPTAITLLVEFRRVFSGALRLHERPIRLLIDGTYGSSASLQSFDKVPGEWGWGCCPPASDT